MTTVVLASTLYGLATAATVLDHDPASADDRRLLVVANNAPMAEIVPDLNEVEGFTTIADRFDRVVSLNAAIAPYHPSEWRPADDDLAVLRRLFRAAWGLGDQPVRLLLESIQVRPAQTLAQLFPDSPITVYADGLMSYGPTRNRLSPDIHPRIERLVLPDLVPGLEPLLLGEYGIEHDTVPLEMLGKTLDVMSSNVTLTAEPMLEDDIVRRGGERVAMIVGQYLGSLGLLSHASERDLHLRMLAVARAHGATRVLFKPHPGSPPSLLEPLRTRAADAGLEFNVVTTRAPIETLLDRIRPNIMISAFSTALVMAQRLHGVRCLQVGSRDLLKSLHPYPNSNRIPLVIVDATIPDGESNRPDELATWKPLATPALNERVRAVGYLMQPERRADLRRDAEVVLERDGAATLNVTRDHLTRLGLADGTPGGALVTRTADSAVGKAARRALRKVRRDGLLASMKSVRR